MTPRVTILAIGLLAVACGRPTEEVPTPDLSRSVDAGGDGDVGTADEDFGDTGPSCPEEIELSDAPEVVQGVGDCSVVLTTVGSTLFEATARSDATELRVTGVAPTGEPNWIAPTVLSSRSHRFEIVSEGPWTATLFDHGPPIETVKRERSLVWTDPELLDDPEVIGLERLMTLAADGDEPGLLFADWLRRFATTAHSERVGPLQFLDELEQRHGDDPTTWDLDALEFRVTGVHNRADLATDDSCGELRVSIASTDQIYQPFHAIFLFEQVPADGDVSPAGTVHCGATLRRWARLSEMEDPAFFAAARELLETALRADTFLMVETVEFIISPWEWRQWVPTTNDDPDAELRRVLDNPRLFQTVDTVRLNEPGPLRDDFLAFVEENAAALDARTAMLPERFRPRSARVNAGVPWVPLDLDGVDPAALDEFPDLRRNIEMMGCPACHATDAEFIQTRPDRTFSPFYDKELDARADYLGAAHRGAKPTAPFGPLQQSPELPP